MPSPSKGAPACKGWETSSQILMFEPNSCVPMRLFRNERSSRMAWPPKSQNMKPTMSSTAAGSRMTVYFPASRSMGFLESRAFCAAISARRAGSSCRTSGELAFCQPEEFSASMVMEISAEVCWYQSLKPRELKMPSTDSEVEYTPAVVSLWRVAMSTILRTPSARSSGVMAAVSSKCRLGMAAAAPSSAAASAGVGMGSKSASGCCTRARFSDDSTTRRRLSSSSLLVVARAVRPPKFVRTEMTWFWSATF